MYIFNHCNINVKIGLIFHQGGGIMKKNNITNNNNKRNVDNRMLKVIRGGADKMSRAATIDRSSASMLSSDSVYDRVSKKEDELLGNLNEVGYRLSHQFDFTDEEINKAIKEVRRECWK